MAKTLKRSFSTDELARLLDVHPETVRRWIRANKVRAVKVGNQHRILRVDLPRNLLEVVVANERNR